MNQDKVFEGIQKVLDEINLDYTEDTIYGITLLLDAHLDDNFTVEEAVNEFLQNSDIELKTEVKTQ